MKIRTAISLLLAIFIPGPPSFAYIRQITNITGDNSPAPLIRTDNTAIQVLLNVNVAPGAANASGNCVTVICPGSDPEAAVRAALATWNAVTTANVKFLPLKSTSLGIDQSDSKMVIAVGTTAAELSAVGPAAAVTVVYYQTSDTVLNGVKVAKGTIVDSDIIINPAISFSTDGSTPSDLQSVITHELGHSLSANHTGLLGASMFQFNAGQRFLTADDLTFINAVYPAPGGGAALGTMSGTITSTAGAPVPYALLTAFDTSAGVTVGGATNPDGTFSMQVPPGSYQMYAEPLNGIVPVNIYLSSAQAALAAGTTFQTTLFSGTLNVAANSTARANITATPGASTLATPIVTITAVSTNATGGVSGGPATVPSGQSVDLVLAGAGFDATLKDSNFAIYGAGIALKPGSVRVDKTQSFNGFNLLRVTLNVDARTTPELASFVVTSGSSVLSFSGALVVVPPTPTFVPAGVISAAAYTGIPSGVSPGGIYSIYYANAPNLGPPIPLQNGPYDAYGNLPSILGGASVTFDGVPAPMFLSWNNQLNFQVPFEIAGKKTTQVIVNYLGSASAPVTVPVLAVQPDFFTSDGKAVIAYNLDDHTLNSAQTPAARGSYIEVYGTGIGKVSYPIATGQGAPPLPAGFTGNYTYSIEGSAPAAALFGGWTPGETGLAQWDLQVPTGIAPGAVPIKVIDSATGASSQSGATIFVK